MQIVLSLEKIMQRKIIIIQVYTQENFSRNYIIKYLILIFAIAPISTMPLRDQEVKGVSEIFEGADNGIRLRLNGSLTLVAVSGLNT